MSVLNLSSYRFVSIHDAQSLRAALKRRADELGLKGTILLAPEGINLFIAGTEQSVKNFVATLAEDRRFEGMDCKYSWSDEQPFNRMLVKLKREIITMRRPDIDPSRQAAPRLTPTELRQWLDEGREVLLVDTRNQFEVDLGTFEGAVELGLHSFSEMPAAMGAIDPKWKSRPVVTFCTGGIRCEKAAPLMASEGFQQVYQLDGGILRYFEDCGGAHYHGECFVFDKRVAVGPDLRPTGTAQCYACQSILSAQDQASPDYVFGQSCPHCKDRNARRAA